MMSKYAPLWQYIKCENADMLTLSFSSIRDILGFEIDHSFLTFKKELLQYGYMVKRISMKEKLVTFEKHTSTEA